MESTGRLAAFTEWLCFGLLLAAFAAIEVLIGGTRMVFSLPAYVLLGLLGLLCVFLIRSARPSPSKGVPRRDRRCSSPISLARAVLSPFPYIARSDLYSVSAGLVVYFFSRAFLRAENSACCFCCFLLLIGMAHAFIGAVQFRDGNNYMPISWLQRFDYESRASGFYICPNHLAGFLEVVGDFRLEHRLLEPLAGVVEAVARLRAWRFATSALVLTGSRGGYLSTGTSLVVFAVLSLIVLRRTSGGLFWKVGGAGACRGYVGGSLSSTAVGRKANS